MDSCYSPKVERRFLKNNLSVYSVPYTNCFRLQILFEISDFLFLVYEKITGLLKCTHAVLSGYVCPSCIR